jgi:hypothetical protein
LKFLINKEVVCTRENGEAILLNMGNGKFYGLDNLGTEIWELIKKEKSYDYIVEKLYNEYKVSKEQLENDIKIFINNLTRFGLVKTNE